MLYLKNNSYLQRYQLYSRMDLVLDEQNILQVRIIRSIVEKHHEVDESWEKILSLSNTG